MSSMKKYYTPSIEEFHVGFEFEALNDADWYWTESTTGWKAVTLNIYNNLSPFGFINLEGAIQKEWIRVKFLDKEDLESLGWKPEHIPHYSAENEFIYGFCIYVDEKVSYSLHALPEVRENVLVIYKSTIYNEHSGNRKQNNIFVGTIKNKSELKRLMGWLRIKTA